MSESANEPRELEPLESLKKSLASVVTALEANEKRRTCLWCLDKISHGMGLLKQSNPNHGTQFAEILEALDCYANLTFKTTEDLDALASFMSVILSNIEELQKSGLSSDDYSRYTKLCYEILDELRTLDEGDPPGLRSVADKSLRDVCYPERRDADRKAVRERAVKRVVECVEKRSSESHNL
jgi:hypothetical protein